MELLVARDITITVVLCGSIALTIVGFRLTRR